ncbi:hypothetical protein VPH35_018302 [Triticum aestivum]
MAASGAAPCPSTPFACTPAVAAPPPSPTSAVSLRIQVALSASNVAFLPHPAPSSSSSSHQRCHPGRVPATPRRTPTPPPAPPIQCPRPVYSSALESAGVPVNRVREKKPETEESSQDLGLLAQM